MKKLIAKILVAVMLISAFACLSACSNTENESPATDIGDTGNGDSDTGPKDDQDEAGMDDIRSFSYPVEDIVKLPGTIADKENKYKKADGYYGAVIDLAGIDYPYVQLEKNESGNELGYAFLAEELTLNATPKYANGYTHCVWDFSKKVTLEIPEDAKYLYVYYSSKEDIHIPKSVTFLDKYINPLINESAAEYVYPLEQIDVLNGYVTSSNVFLRSSSIKGAIIELEGTTFNTVTMKKNANGNAITYAFMGDELCYDLTPCYAAGYTNVVSVNEESITVRIPDNARYLYVYNNNSATMYLPSEIKFTKESYGPENPNSVRIATWNIGHFSLGHKDYSTIEDTQFAMKNADFSDYINNAIDADIMFLNEYSKKFTKNKYLAKDTIFKGYDTVYEGPQRNYSCNAVYSKIEISQPEVHEFECNKDLGKLGQYAPEGADYYFVTTDLVINGTTVKLVSTHLAFGSNNIVANQIKELIEYCEQYEHVVLLGDWNVNTFSDFNLFTDAGYTLGNTDKNMPTYEGGSSLDNIVYKGVTVTDFTLAGTDLSDHYALYCTVTVDE